MTRTEPEDPEEYVRRALEGVPVDQIPRLLAALGAAADGLSSPMDGLFSDPEVREPPAHVGGFRVRVDLVGAKPPVWRRLDVPGDLTLDMFHVILQEAMGWSNCHLHRFRQGSARDSPFFVTEFDIAEGEDGVLEDEVRLDQVIVRPGDVLSYEYDFGDSWDHRVKVEAVLDEPPAVSACLTGRLACPPEDCGGIGGYFELADWVRGGYPDDATPLGLSAVEMREWLPHDWDPDEFSIDEVNAALQVAASEPVMVSDELASLVDDLAGRGSRTVGGRPQRARLARAR